MFQVQALMMLCLAAGLAVAKPTICMSSPVYDMMPGSIISARLDSRGSRCKATLSFSNPSFLPVYIGFAAINCMDLQVAEFMLPVEVPNGEARIFWQCAGQPAMCNKAMISGGTEDSNKIVNELIGTIGCLDAVATETNIFTSTALSTTVTSTSLATMFTTSVPLTVPTSVDGTGAGQPTQAIGQTTPTNIVDVPATAITTAAVVTLITSGTSVQTSTIGSTTILGVATTANTFPGSTTVEQIAITTIIATSMMTITATVTAPCTTGTQ